MPYFISSLWCLEGRPFLCREANIIPKIFCADSFVLFAESESSSTPIISMLKKSCAAACADFDFLISKNISYELIIYSVSYPLKLSINSKALFFGWSSRNRRTRTVSYWWRCSVCLYSTKWRVSSDCEPWAAQWSYCSSGTSLLASYWCWGRIN